MNFKLTASAVFSAALISGCSSAPTLNVPTGEWESFNQTPSYPSQRPSQPSASTLSQEPAVTVYKPAPAASFIPPAASAARPIVVAVAPVTVTRPAPTVAAVVATSPVAVVAPVIVKPSTPAVPALPSPAAKPLITAATTAGSPPLSPISNASKVSGAQVGVITNQVPKNTAVAASPEKISTLPAPSVPAPVKPVALAPKPLQAWSVSPQDKTIRETLAKWSAIAGYSFNPIGRQNWTVPEDFDVVASDTMYGDFKTVVRRLIASTELTKTPLQPCFYSNRVVRVKLINEDCNTQASQIRNQ